MVGQEIRMNKTKHDAKWLTEALAVTTGIAMFRLVSGILQIVTFLALKIPYDFVWNLCSVVTIVTPAVAVACAVLLCRWPEKKLVGARGKTKIGILAVLSVCAFSPFQYRIEAMVTLPPNDQMEMKWDFQEEIE
jgi:hypothetical protein